MTQVATKKSMVQTMRNGVFAVGICASLAIGSIGFSSHAEARVSDGDPRVDSLAAGCGALQDQADALKAQYKAIAEANPGDPRLDDILSQLRQIGQNWNSVCAGTFGSINLVPFTPPNGVAQLNGSTTLEQGPSGGSKPAQQTAGIGRTSAAH